MHKVCKVALIIFSIAFLTSCTPKSTPNWDSKNIKVDSKNIYKVKKGSISLKLDGIGTLVPLKETNLYFNEVSGVMQNLNIKVNDIIKEGQVVGEISDDDINNQLQLENNNLSTLNIQLGINQLSKTNSNKTLQEDDISLDIQSKIVSSAKKNLDSSQTNLNADKSDENQKDYDSCLLEYQKEQASYQRLVIEKQQHENDLISLKKNEVVINYNIQNSGIKIKSLQKSLENCKLVARTGGKVTFVDDISLLDYINSGRIIAKIVEPKNYVVEFMANDLKGLNYGDKVKIDINDVTYDGSVYEPASADLIKAQDPTDKVKNTAYLLLDKIIDNISVKDKVPVSLITQQKTDVIIVPRTAIKISNSKNTVNKYVNGKVETVEIVKGIEVDNNVEIISGINVDDEILTSY